MVFVYRNCICYFIAVLLYNLRSKVLLKAYNTIMILPTFLSMVLISYIVYAILNPADGILNQLFVKLGIGKVDWYADPKPWPAILTVVDQWKGVGMGCIIYYATLVGINPELFEAARVDGANKVQQSWYIAIPELKPVVAIKIIMGFGGLFSGDFGLFYQITRNSAALYPTTDIINTYTFRALTENNDIATSSAIGLVQSVIGLIMILVVNAIIRKISYENRLF